MDRPVRGSGLSPPRPALTRIFTRRDHPPDEMANLPFGSGVLVRIASKAHLPHVSALSRPGTRPGIRPVIHPPPAEEPGTTALVSCCLSAAGLRFLRHPVPPGD
jgi:hypothetical protein